MNNKTWKLSYNLITSDGIEPIESQFMYFETCMAILKSLNNHCYIDDINIKRINKG